MFGLSWAFFIGLSLWALEACHQYEKTEKGGNPFPVCCFSSVLAVFLCHSSLSGVNNRFSLSALISVKEDVFLYIWQGGKLFA